MKKGLTALAMIVLIASCGPSSTQDGVDNDGIKAIDSNGGLADTTYQNESATDSSVGEDRVDISRRDTFDKKPNQ